MGHLTNVSCNIYAYALIHVHTSKCDLMPKRNHDMPCNNGGLHQNNKLAFITLPRYTMTIITYKFLFLNLIILDNLKLVKVIIGSLFIIMNFSMN